MKILLLGATGLVGSELLKLLEQDPGISKIYAPTRKPLPPSEKLVNPVADDLSRRWQHGRPLLISHFVAWVLRAKMLAAMPHFAM